MITVIDVEIMTEAQPVNSVLELLPTVVRPVFVYLRRTA